MKSGQVGLLVGLLWLLVMRCSAGETARAVATVTSGFVTGITVMSGGSGYTFEPTVTISGGGGNGATAKAILSGDKVSLVVVLTAGNGYVAPPTVSIEAPPKALGLLVELVPKLTVEGPPGTVASVQWALDLSGPWIGWTNLVVGTEGVSLVDVSPGSARRFYRAVTILRPVGPLGFVWIPPGTFVMGSPVDEPERYPDEVQHMVTLTRGFWLSDHEVTQGEYEVLIGNNPSLFRGDANLPVEQVNFYEATTYCQRLTERDRAAGRIAPNQLYRLPTEAEFEYAARAGTTGARYGELDSIAWWSGNSGGQTHSIKQKIPNGWGLYDMIGNVWEWCSDWYGDYPTESVTDPKGPSSGDYQVCRGGRLAQRRQGRLLGLYARESRGSFLGFRVVLSEAR